MVCRLTAGGRWIRTIGSASWRAHEVRPDSLPERAGFELSVPGDGELCWGALTLGCIRGDRSAGAGTVQCDFFCSAGFENAQATRFFPAQHDVPTRQRSQQPTPLTIFGPRPPWIETAASMFMLCS